MILFRVILFGSYFLSFLLFFSYFLRSIFCLASFNSTYVLVSFSLSVCTSLSVLIYFLPLSLVGFILFFCLYLLLSFLLYTFLIPCYSHVVYFLTILVTFHCPVLHHLNLHFVNLCSHPDSLFNIIPFSASSIFHSVHAFT